MGTGTIKIIKFDAGRVSCLVDTTPNQWVTILRIRDIQYFRVNGSNYRIDGKTGYRMKEGS